MIERDLIERSFVSDLHADDAGRIEKRGLYHSGCFEMRSLD